MDEKQYRSTYHSINPERCVFEKAINTRVCNCSKAQRFNLADREGVACKSAAGLERCSNLISQLRDNARFVFQRIETSQVLGHTEEIKIQNGGLLGLQSLICSDSNKTIEDIDNVIVIAIDKFKSLEQLPYSELMQSISNYKTRNKRKKTRKK